MKYRVCMYHIIDIPDGEIDGEKASTAEIAEDAQRFIDEYARRLVTHQSTYGAIDPWKGRVDDEDDS